MQVLGWQCRMLRKHALEYDNLELSEDADSLDLASTMIAGGLATPGGGAGGGPSPPGSLHTDQAGLVLAGFRDCSEEAIRYLVDVEHLSEDDPLILGLKQHLWERQQHLDIERIISEHMCWSDSLLQHPLHPHTQEEGMPFSSLHQQSQDSLGASSHHQFDISAYSASPHSDIHMYEIDDLNRSENSSQLDQLNDSSTSSISQHSSSSLSSSSPSVITPVSVPPQYNTTSLVESDSSSADMSQSVLNLALLAQNNPAIASLTEELLSLLGGEQQDSDLDSDLDFEESQDSD